MPGWWDWGIVYDHRQWYFIMQAACFFPLTYSILFYDKKDELHNNVFIIFVWCLVSNLFDELFFDPIHLGINEILFAIFIITSTIYRCRRLKKKH